MVLEIQIHFVQEHPGVLAAFSVFHDTVLDGLQRDHQGGRTELFSHFIEVQCDDPAVHINISGMGKDIQAALGNKLGGQGDFAGLRVYLFQYLVAPVGQERHRGLATAMEIVLIDIGGTAVNDGFMAAVDPSHTHLLL